MTGADVADEFRTAAINTTHRRGIGRRLFEAMRRDYEKQEFTVNSSPYAVEIYKRLGFVQEDAERLSPEGLRYTPMRFTESR